MYQGDDYGSFKNLHFKNLFLGPKTYVDEWSKCIKIFKFLVENAVALN